MNTKVIKTHFLRLFFISSSLALSIILLPNAGADGGGTYSVYDKDRDGYLDRIEFEKLAASKRKRSTNLDIWKFENVDVDRDRKISEQEMVDALIKDMKHKQKNKNK